MADKQPRNCWDFFKCEKQSKERCHAYTTNSGHECWMVASRLFKKCECAKVKKLENCWECPWFKKVNPSFDCSKLD